MKDYDRDDDYQERPERRPRRRTRDDEYEESSERSPRRRRKSNNPERSAQDLYLIAQYQKAVIYSILAIICVGISFAAMPKEFEIPRYILYALAAITAAVFVCLLSIRIFGTALAIICALLTLVPVLGFLVLVVINSMATNTLNSHDVRVGFLGVGGREIARLRKLAERDDEDDDD